MKKLIFVCIVLSSCSEPQDIIVPMRKTGVVCRDGKVMEWRQDILTETSNTTQYPCQSNGGIIKYLYK